MKWTTKSPQETQELAQELLKKHPQEKCWLLKGNLGAGKTSFVKGAALYFKEDPSTVKSPTYTYLNQYKDFVHYDLYRLTQPDDQLLEQIEEHLEQGLTLFIEWPERIPELFSHPNFTLNFKHLDEGKREISIDHS
jgi:tRNA threonylcarbamoyladenosine biosynthesis protein TsaE